jgi:cation transport ATPase
VREALAQDAPVKPPIDTSKIYNQPPGPTGQSTTQAGAQPTPGPHTNELSATTQRRTSVQVASVVPGLQLYAIVMIILSGLNILAYINRLTDLYGPHTVSLLSVFINILPIASALYLLRGKRTIIIKALLIVIGLAYAYLFVSYGVLVTQLHSVLATIFVFTTLVCGGLVYWTWRIFSNVEGLEEER